MNVLLKAQLWLSSQVETVGLHVSTFGPSIAFVGASLVRRAHGNIIIILLREVSPACLDLL